MDSAGLAAIFNTAAHGGAVGMDMYSKQKYRDADLAFRKQQHRDNLTVDNRKLDLMEDNVGLAYNQFISNEHHRNRVYDDYKAEHARVLREREMQNISAKVTEQAANGGFKSESDYLEQSPDSLPYWNAMAKHLFADKLIGSKGEQFQWNDDGTMSLQVDRTGDGSFETIMTRDRAEMRLLYNQSKAKQGIPDLLESLNIKAVPSEKGDSHVFIGIDGKPLSQEMQNYLTQISQQMKDKSGMDLQQLLLADDPSQLLVDAYNKKYGTQDRRGNQEKGLSAAYADQPEADDPKPEPYKHAKGEPLMSEGFIAHRKELSAWHDRQNDKKGRSLAEVLKDPNTKGKQKSFANYEARRRAIIASGDQGVREGIAHSGSFVRLAADRFVDVTTTPLKYAAGLGSAFVSGATTGDVPDPEGKTSGKSTVINEGKTGEPLGGTTTGQPPVNGQPTTNHPSGFGMDALLSSYPRATPEERKRLTAVAGAWAQMSAGSKAVDNKLFQKMMDFGHSGGMDINKLMDVMTKGLNYQKTMLELQGKQKEQFMKNDEYGLESLQNYFKSRDSRSGSGKSQKGSFDIGKFGSPEAAASFAWTAANANANYLAQQGYPTQVVGYTAAGGQQVSYRIIDASKMTPALWERLERIHLREFMKSHGKKGFFGGDAQDNSAKVKKDGPALRPSPYEVYMGYSAEEQKEAQRRTNMTHDQLLQHFMAR